MIRRRRLPDVVPVPRVRLPAADVAEAVVEYDCQERQARRAMREARGGYNAGHRCRSCHKFVAGPTARCGACGQEHGGIYGTAQATR